MDIKQLQAFDCIVRLGSFSKAARYLNLSQPTISIRIQGLEKSVGGALFTRVGKTLELTDLGKGFLPYCRQALEIMIKGVDRARAIQEGKVGQITIGTLPTFSTGIFSSAIQNLYENYPEINIEIHTGHNQQIIEMLYDGFVKVGFMTHPDYNPDLKNLLILKEPLLLVAHYSHPIVKLINEKDVSVSEIMKLGDPYIIVDWSEQSKHWQKSSINQGKKYLELPPTTALDLVCSGFGITLLTESLVADKLQSKTLVTLQPKDFPALFREIIMVSLDSQNTFSPAVKSFIKCLTPHEVLLE